MTVLYKPFCFGHSLSASQNYHNLCETVQQNTTGDYGDLDVYSNTYYSAFLNAHDVAHSNTDDDISVLDNSNSDGVYNTDKLDDVDDLDYADPDHSSPQCVSTGGRARLLSACTVGRPCQVIK